MRALEVFEASGRPIAEWQQGRRETPLLDLAECVALFLAPEREALRGRIDRRFGAMLAEGALAEVEALGRRKLDPALPAMRAHGVPWLLRHLRGEISLEEAAREAKADTRRYAKRQFTWFRHQLTGFPWVKPEEAEAAVLAAIEAMQAENRRHGANRSELAPPTSPLARALGEGSSATGDPSPDPSPSAQDRPLPQRER